MRVSAAEAPILGSGFRRVRGFLVRQIYGLQDS